jgi:hypothetical protein
MMPLVRCWRWGGHRPQVRTRCTDGCARPSKFFCRSAASFPLKRARRVPCRHAFRTRADTYRHEPRLRGRAARRNDRQYRPQQHRPFAGRWNCGTAMDCERLHGHLRSPDPDRGRSGRPPRCPPGLRPGLRALHRRFPGCALAPSLSVLVAGRVLQGVGAAILVPNSLALLNPNSARQTGSALRVALFGSLVAGNFISGLHRALAVSAALFAGHGAPHHVRRAPRQAAVTLRL